ncbi:steroid 17-alpha-hydroxylase/17,20 lyase-like [Haliotis rubra]|uniref:steroid 17-alpha-hydroxylase/17,20 lyase-like n=1 Tax=Haliotis rubra TaxID=36100 RepID=UPI001EE5A073|nr:steroid 17-alpha-hydroxylase/17,20 lyase-like [Haliotis rubra]XP_046567782.1 steroid 17-alpha-hydroxylase/17,20 lyase-like [Haliotis rubra]
MFECLTQWWPQSVITQALVVGIVVGVIAYNLFKKRYNLPPGPKGWPLVGNLLEVRGTLLFRKLRDWSKTYGPVMTIQLGTLKAVILSRIDVVTEALITRQADFAGRPDTYVVTKLTKGGKDIVNASYGPTWKLHRKITSKALRHYLMGDNLSRKVSQSLNITTTLMRKEQGAFDPFPYLSLSISNMMTGMLFNKISENVDSEYYKAYVVTLDDFMKEAGEGFLEDSIPPLRLCPTPRFRRVTRVTDKLLDSIKKEIAAHRKTFNKDEIRDFTDALIQAQQEADEGDDPVLMSQITNIHMAMTIFDLVFAGTETSRNTLHWCLLTMALHPDIQKKVHQEVDSVIGPDLNVHVSDRENLPYTDAVIHEVMRLRSVVPIGVAHSTLCDTTVGGYDVPKGTMVIINHDALHFDPDQWEDVNTFKPERFLDSDGKMGPKPDSWLPFSAGRRVCLGETVAKPELHLFLAGIMRVFTISLPPGTQHDFEPQSTGAVNTPGRYKIVMKSRI